MRIWTEIGGPKEYYGTKAYVVSPYSVDIIGKAIVDAMVEDKFQPQLMCDIKAKYSLAHCVANLINEYSK